jgi:Spy/CpxP family protein refolding chaperone
MYNALFATIFAAVFAAAPAAWAQDKPANGTDVAMLKAAVKADKKALVASTLTLSADEAKKFWPLYDDYQRKLDALNRRISRLVEEIIAQGSKPVSDAMAKSLLKESLAIEDEEVRARRGYQNRLVKVLPTSKALRYLQLENKIRVIQDYDIATVMPLVN